MDDGRYPTDHRSSIVSALRSGDLRLAIALLRREIAVVPDASALHVQLGGVLAELGRQRHALAVLERARRLGATERDVLGATAYCLDALGEMRAAEALLEGGLQRDPGSLFARQLLINIAVKTDQFAKARDMVHDLLNRPDLADGQRLALAQILAWLDEPSKAVPHLLRIAGESPADARSVATARRCAAVYSGSPESAGLIRVETLAGLEEHQLCRRLPLTPYRNLLHMRDARIGVDSQSVLVGDRLCRDFCYHIDHGALHDVVTLFNPRYGMKRAARMEALDEAVFIGGGRNYYHWMIDYLPGLGALEHRGLFRDLPVVFGRTLSPFQRQSLERIGFDLRRWHNPGDGEVVACTQLWATGRASGRRTVMGMPDWWQPEADIETVGWLREVFLPHPAGARPHPHRRLYVSRGEAGVRRLLNEEDILAMLESAGYEVVHPERLSVGEQASLFAEASHVVGVHGAGLTNMVFMAPGTRVFEIVAPYRRPAFYEHLARLLGVGHRHLEAEVVEVKRRPPFDDPRFGNIRVETRALRQALGFFDPAITASRT